MKIPKNWKLVDHNKSHEMKWLSSDNIAVRYDDYGGAGLVYDHTIFRGDPVYSEHDKKIIHKYTVLKNFKTKSAAMRFASKYMKEHGGKI